jgi:hypothetical protein
MNAEQIKNKFGAYYIADDLTFKMGIDVRFTDHLARRFNNLTVLETCTGGGFSTLSLSSYARHVYSHELFCLHFGKMAKLIGKSEHKV